MRIKYVNIFFCYTLNCWYRFFWSRFMFMLLFFLQILLDIKTLLMSQPSLIDVPIGDNDKFTVCGDIHGQFYDLMNIFTLNGLPSKLNPYVSFFQAKLINNIIYYCM